MTDEDCLFFQVRDRGYTFEKTRVIIEEVIPEGRTSVKIRKN